MISPPDYFEPIRQSASRRWDQLEADPDLAGPWHQLFRQVQSPRHVLSELLQNADDAGATRASVTVDEEGFLFGHDGQDFEEDHFRSLCRFAYSNKRHLHTIGFRGIGFKSVFSLGDIVRLSTPSLGVEFHRDRFTEPHWNGTTSGDGRTIISVDLKDEGRRKEVEKNLREWVESAYSFLFFKSLRTLEVEGAVVSWEGERTGPVPRSAWLGLGGASPEYLVIRSEPGEFPDDAVSEVRDERGASSDFDLPACEVTIVLGAAGRLFVVLPTGVRPDLPFAINAPFVQDPARVGIKDPSISPTNRWLLDRAGRLAAQAMLGWLNRSDLPDAERAKAYDLLVEPPGGDDSIEEACRAIVYEAFFDELGNKPCIITDRSALALPDAAVVLPGELFEIWSTTEVTEILGIEDSSTVSHALSDAVQKKLRDYFNLDWWDRSKVASRLTASAPPKPKTWRRLLTLWAFLGPELAGPAWRDARRRVRLSPVPGSPVLHPAAELVRLGDKRLLNREEDWQFLSTYVDVLDPNWPRYLRKAEGGGDESILAQIERAIDLQVKLGLDSISTPTKVFERFVGLFSARGEDNQITTWVRVAEIGAALGASPPSSSFLVTRDRQLRPPTELVYDTDGGVTSDHPEAWVDSHVLNELYSGERVSCTPADWDRWISAHLQRMPPIAPRPRSYWNKSDLELELRKRGRGEPVSPSYSYPDFRLEDHDFEDQFWAHWHSIAESDPQVWERVLKRLLAGGPTRPETRECRATEIARNGYRRSLAVKGVPAGWLAKLRELPCLRDTKGFLHTPSELLCRTQETEALQGVEPFVHIELDTPQNRELLVALGVGTRPNNAEIILRKLRALSTVEQPPVIEVGRLYQALDGVAAALPSGELIPLKQVFVSESLIFTAEAGWVTSANAFRYGDEADAPEAPLVLAELKDLSLWSRIDVAERPTAEMALAWLSNLPTGMRLSPEEIRRVRALQQRYPQRVWSECDRWLTLSSKLTDTSDLKFASSMQSLGTYSDLFSWVQDTTANFQMLGTSVLAGEPFNHLPALASSIEERLSEQTSAGRDLPQPWLNALAETLSRVRLPDEDQQAATRQLAETTTNSRVLCVESLKTQRYLDGMPAGTPRSASAIWADRCIYVLNLPPAQLMKPLTDEIARRFEPYGLGDTVRLCYQRDPAFVRDYLAANFEFDPVPEGEQESAESDAEGPIADQAGSILRPGASVTPSTHAAGLAPVNDHGSDDEQPAPPVGPADDGPSVEEADSSDDATRGEIRTPRTRPTHPQHPSLMERLARSLGYHPDGAGQFRHPNGMLLRRVPQVVFPWEETSPDGTLERCYWSKEVRWKEHPVELEAEVWNGCIQDPESRALVLEGPDGEPEVVTGDQLRNLQTSGLLQVHAASYRIVIAHE